MNAAADSRPDGQTYALAYALHGWHVLPIKPGAKVPGTRHGHHDATRDSHKIRAWWSRTPNANVGVAVEPSRLIVIDIDPRNGGALNALPALPPTLTARTGGGGVHLFFRRPRDCQKLPGKLAAGIDLKSDGYVLVMPSVTRVAYMFEGFDPLHDPQPTLAEYPVALLHGSAPIATQPAKPASAPTKAAHTLPDIIPQGERNATLLRLAAGLVRCGFVGDALNRRVQKLNAERCKPPLGADEVDTLAARATAYGSPGYVMLPHRLLDSHGWRALSPAAQTIAMVAIRRAVNDVPFALAAADFAGRPGFRKRGAFYRHRAELLHAGFLQVTQHGRRTQQGCAPDLYAIAPGAPQGSLSHQREPSELAQAQVRKVTKGNPALGNQREPVFRALDCKGVILSCARDGDGASDTVSHARYVQDTKRYATATMASLCVLVDNRPLHIPCARDYYAMPVQVAA